MYSSLDSNTQRFSIVLPVWNGGEYIKLAINSILSQTVQDFNLIVLDNASSDGTVEWLRQLNDPRIEIHISDTFLSIEQNWDRIKKLRRNKWMMIMGHDDIMQPDYLKVMASLIEKHPQASLYQCHFNFIDDRGGVIRNCKPMAEVQSAADFLRETKENGGGFMFRSDDYDAVGGIPLFPNLFFADFALWIELSWISYKATAIQHCFSYRVHSRNTSATSPDEKYHIGFKLFVEYLYSLKNRDEQFKETINKHARSIIELFCKSLSHRLLRTPFGKRNGLSVSAVIKQYKEYADLLIDNNSFDPNTVPSIRIAKIIDNNALTRKLFLLFKRIYSKPVF